MMIEQMTNLFLSLSAPYGNCIDATVSIYN